MNVSPLISVIMPLYNGARYLPAALNSIFAQEHRPLEVIVVDDGSCDTSAEICGWYEDRIRYIRQDNAGPAAARNTGLAAMTGEFYTFLDADDLWHPAKLSTQLGDFDRIPELDVALCLVRNFWDGDPAEEAERFREREYEPVMTAIVLQAVLCRRHVYDRLGPLDTRFRFGEDSDWYLRLRQSGLRTALRSEILGYRRIHELNMTVDLPAQKDDVMFQILKASVDRNRNRRPSEV